jgi:uncharacterized ParB-like nuclease family protein
MTACLDCAKGDYISSAGQVRPVDVFACELSVFLKK